MADNNDKKRLIDDWLRGMFNRYRSQRDILEDEISYLSRSVYSKWRNRKLIKEKYAKVKNINGEWDNYFKMWVELGRL